MKRGKPRGPNSNRVAEDRALIDAIRAVLRQRPLYSEDHPSPPTLYPELP